VHASILTLDRGNTTIDVMLHSAQGAPRRLRIAPTDVEQLGAFLATERPSVCAAVTVVPHKLGADRWIGALAAHRRFGAAITVDCGSATTVNLVDAAGTFRGGAIAPGLRALGLGMAQVTPHLPRAEAEHAERLPARSSAAAVHAGVAYAFCGAIERLVAELLGASGGPARIVLTGGHAEDYLRHGRLACEHVPDLVHQGLRMLVDPACAS
jgi:type III pantothenate kinase